MAQGLLLGMAIAIVLPTFQNQVNLSLTIVGGLMIMILYMWAMKLIQGLERK